MSGYTLRSGRRVLGTIRPTETRGVFLWSSRPTGDRGVTTGLDNAIRIVLREAQVSTRQHEVDLVDDATGKHRSLSDRPMRGPSRDASTHHHRAKGAPSFAMQAKISRKIRMLVREEGKSPKQAAAIAYRYYGVARPRERDAGRRDAPIDKARLLESLHRAGYKTRSAPRRRGEEYARLRVFEDRTGRWVGDMTPAEAQALVKRKRR